MGSACHFNFFHFYMQIQITKKLVVEPKYDLNSIKQPK